MAIEVQRKYARTNIFILDPELWAWAQYKAKLLGYKSVSEYLFKIIKVNKEKDVRAHRRKEIVEFVAKRHEAILKEDLEQHFCNRWNEPPRYVQEILDIAKGARDLSIKTLYEGTEKERTYVIHTYWAPGEDGAELQKDKKLVIEVELRRSRTEG